MELFYQQPTIFASIASYRDKLCTKTLESIFSNAEYPDRVYIGICQQNAEEDSECANFDSDILRPYLKNIKIIKLPHHEARGPCFARYWCSTLYNGEDYFAQLDSHILMAKNWDSKAIRMISEIKSTTDSKKVVLSHYTKNYEEYGVDNPNNEVPRMCRAFFNDSGMISFEGAENISIDTHTYIQTPFVAGGFIFTEGQFLKDVPFDPHLDYIFVGEEITLSARTWTAGYDIYTPSENLVFHLYTRKDDNKIWTDKTYTDIDAMKKLKSMLKLDTVDVPEHLKESMKHYNLGTERSLEDFYNFAGINIQNKTVTKDFCKEESLIETFQNQTSNYTYNISSIQGIIVILLILILIFMYVFLSFRKVRK